MRLVGLIEAVSDPVIVLAFLAALLPPKRLILVCQFFRLVDDPSPKLHQRLVSVIEDELVRPIKLSSSHRYGGRPGKRLHQPFGLLRDAGNDLARKLPLAPLIRKRVRNALYGTPNDLQSVSFRIPSLAGRQMSIRRMPAEPGDEMSQAGGEVGRGRV